VRHSVPFYLHRIVKMFFQCLLLLLVPLIRAQTLDPGNPGVENTDASCGIAGYPAPGQVYYYAPDDTLPLGEYVTSTGCKLSASITTNSNAMSSLHPEFLRTDHAELSNRQYRDQWKRWVAILWLRTSERPVCRVGLVIRPWLFSCLC
jgi:hypothetical protein